MNMRQKKKFKKKLNHKKYITSKTLVKIQKAVMGISKDCLLRGIGEDGKRYEEMVKKRQEMHIEQMKKRARYTYGLCIVEIDLAKRRG